MLTRAVLACVLLAGSWLLGDDTGTCWATAWRCDTINTYRADHDQPPLDQAATLQQTAGAWARHMATTGILAHSPAAGHQYGEVVGYSTSWGDVLTLWDQSTPHRVILLDRDAARVGIGRAVDAGGRVWCVVQLTD